jgi:hypothetical protein
VPGSYHDGTYKPGEKRATRAADSIAREWNRLNHSSPLLPLQKFYGYPKNGGIAVDRKLGTREDLRYILLCMNKRLLSVVFAILSLVSFGYGDDEPVEFRSSITDKIDEDLASTNVNRRLLAQSDISSFSPEIPTDILMEYLLRGARDIDDRVKVAAIHAFNANATKVISAKGIDDLEKILLSLRTSSDPEYPLFFAALTGLANINYLKNSFPTYCRWEDSELLPVVNALRERSSSRPYAASLCGVIRSPSNIPSLVEILREMLRDDSAEVQFYGILAIASFEDDSILLNSRLIAYAALRPDLRNLVENKNLDERLSDAALIAMTNLDRKLQSIQNRLGLDMRLSPSRSR